MSPIRKIEGRGRRILVVDDDLAIRVLLDAVLKRMGFEVMVASDGKTALDLKERYDYDLILLDLLMPVMSGYEVLAKLPVRKKPHVIVFSGVEHDSVRQLPADKVCDSIRKPFDLELFTSTVARCIDAEHGTADQPSPSSQSVRADS